MEPAIPLLPFPPVDPLGFALFGASVKGLKLLYHGKVDVIFQLVSFPGAVLVLGAYLASSHRWPTPGDHLYNPMNLFGGLVLPRLAVVDRRIGFMILRLTWAPVALPPLLRPPLSEGP
jgi:hypothetical protein